MSRPPYKVANYAPWVSVIGHFALVLLKGGVGYVSGSKALLADAAYSFSDVAKSVTSMVGRHASKHTPPEQRMTDQRKIDSTVTIIAAVFILLLSIQVGFNAANTLITGIPKPVESYTLIVVFAAMLLRWIFTRYSDQSNNVSSQPLRAINSRKLQSTVFHSMIVFGAVSVSWLAGQLNMPQLFIFDPFAGVYISIVVFRNGLRLLSQVLEPTNKTELPQENTEPLMVAVQKIKGVIAVDEIRAKEHGHYVVIDVSIRVNPRISVMEGHEIAKSIKLHLMSSFHHVADVCIHVQPFDLGYPYKHNMESGTNELPTVIH